MKGQHPTVFNELPPRAMSTTNCFFLCQDPQTYYELFGASPYASPEAIYIRDVITRWSAGRIPGITHWLNGWKIAKNVTSPTPTSPNVIQNSSLSSTSSLSSQSAEKSTEESSLTTCITEPTMTTTKTPKRLLEMSLDLLSIVISDNVTAYASLDTNDIVKIHISSSIFQQRRYLDAITRRIPTLTQHFVPPSGTWVPATDAALKDQCAQILSIDANFITGIQQQSYHTFKIIRTTTPTQTETENSLTNTNRNQEETETVLNSTTINKNNEENETGNTLTMNKNTELTDINNNAEKQETTKSTEEPCNSEIIQKKSTEPTNLILSPPTHSPLNYESDEESLRSPTPCSLHSEGSPSLSPTKPTCLPDSPPTLFDNCVTPSYEPNSTIGVTSLTEQPEPAAQTSSDHPSCMQTPSQEYTPAAPKHLTSTSIYRPTPIHKTAGELAKNLLLTGCLPVLPPGRRDWSAVPDECIVISSNLRWPPKNWKSFSSEQKLLAAEYAAMTLEQTTPSFHPVNRNSLLGKYNFLILPSTTLKSDSLFSKMQQYNYINVKSIAEGTAQYSTTDQLSVVRCFTPAPKTDFLEKISHVPLRLQDAPEH